MSKKSKQTSTIELYKALCAGGSIDLKKTAEHLKNIRLGEVLTFNEKEYTTALGENIYYIYRKGAGAEAVQEFEQSLSSLSEIFKALFDLSEEEDPKKAAMLLSIIKKNLGIANMRKGKRGKIGIGEIKRLVSEEIKRVLDLQKELYPGLRFSKNELNEARIALDQSVLDKFICNDIKKCWSKIENNDRSLNCDELIKLALLCECGILDIILLNTKSDAIAAEIEEIISANLTDTYHVREMPADVKLLDEDAVASLPNIYREIGRKKTLSD
ncbi:MAG: hypothetical protein FWD58_05540 [Firmicutes bacterium]|nr:hypothetical protein [Bacillota bacterium]